MSEAPRYRLDDLRGFASALAARLGVAPSRASSLASHLLWHDAAGLEAYGIAALPTWLDRLASTQVNSANEGKVIRETIGTAVFDGERGLPALILARAGELAVEKARDAGTGLVRVTNVDSPGPAAAIVAELAIGPVAVFVAGPGPEWALGLPSSYGLPVVFDSGLASGGAERPRVAPADLPAPFDLLARCSGTIVRDGDWMISTLGIGAIDTLTEFQARVSDSLRDVHERPGCLLPEKWETHRREAREHGVSIAPELWKRLTVWADRLAVALPPAMSWGRSALPGSGSS